MYARSRADIDNVVRRAHGILVMLHHDHGVAQITHALKRIDQLLIVSLVQTDGRFVEHIQHAHQGGPDLRGQTDALRFTA